MSRAPKGSGLSKRTKVSKELLDELVSQEGMDELRKKIKEVSLKEKAREGGD